MKLPSYGVDNLKPRRRACHVGVGRLDTTMVYCCRLLCVRRVKTVYPAPPRSWTASSCEVIDYTVMYNVIFVKIDFIKLVSEKPLLRNWYQSQGIRVSICRPIMDLWMIPSPTITCRRFFFKMCLPSSKQFPWTTSQMVLCNQPSGVSG